jgi:hypothetical protein
MGLSRWIFAVAALLGAASCVSPDYGDAGATRTPLPTRYFNYDNSGNAVCDGSLYGYVSEGTARCSSPPQQCHSGATTSGRVTLCACDGTSGSDGEWSCHEVQP